MAIKEYDIIDEGQCSVCGCTEDIVIDEDGKMICVHCLFEQTCEEQYGGMY